MQTRGLFFKPGFTGLTAFKPGYPGLFKPGYPGLTYGGSLVSGRLANQYKLPIFLYGLDCWAISKMDARKIRVRVGRERRSRSFLYNGNVVPVVFFCILQLLTD